MSAIASTLPIKRRLLSKLANADEEQGVDGAQKVSVHKVLEASSTGATKLFAAVVELRKQSSAFTLLEVMIALTLVAVLMAAAIPYMTDAFGKNQGEQISAAVATLVEQTRTAALSAGESKYIEFTESTFSQLFPQGWKFQIERMNDKKFRDPNNGETWEFNNEGICDPLTLRLLGPGTPITMKFDPITGDVIHDD